MTKWTRKLIIRDILRREATGLPLTVSGENGVSPQAYKAAARIFGSWHNAVQAAGISGNKARPKAQWPPNRILRVIRSLARRRSPISTKELEQRYGPIIPAARRCFGSWSKALVAAGVNSSIVERRNVWPKERIVEAILLRAINNEPLRRLKVQPQSLANAGARAFGSWRAALAVAGIDLTTIDRSPRHPVEPKTTNNLSTPAVR